MWSKGYFLLCFILLMGCNSDRNIDVQGHRGFRGLYPENTLLGFEKAIDLGVTTLELDVCITKDQKVLVSHEPFMSRTICLDPNGLEIDNSLDMYYNIYEMTHEEIKTFDCGLKHHPNFSQQKKIGAYKPLLSEVFDLVNAIKSDVNFNIEIKSDASYYGIYTPNPKNYVEIVLETIKTNPITGKVNLQSFDLAILEEIHLQDPTIPIALLVDENESIEDKLKALSFKPEIISPYFKLLFSRSHVATFQEGGYRVIPWTVNKQEDLIKMWDYKVDGIITDYPNLLLKLLKMDFK